MVWCSGVVRVLENGGVHGSLEESSRCDLMQENAVWSRKTVFSGE